MEEKKEERNSSLEILRIICMIIIILHHYVVHGVWSINITEIPKINAIITSMMLIGGKLVCNIFVLITGYFLIKSKFNIKKIINLIIKMFVYSIGIYIIFRAFNLIEYDKETFIKQIFPTIWGNWFVVNYIILYILSPIINKMLTKLDKTNYFRLICILLIVWSIIPTITKDAWTYSYLDAFIIMYIIGAYIRLYGRSKENNIKNFIIMLIGSVIFIITAIKKTFNISEYTQVIALFARINDILVVIIAIYTFKFFANIKFVCKPINYIASSMLGVYLIHDNDLVRPYLWTQLSSNMNYVQTGQYIKHIILKTGFILIACIIIDKIVTKILELTIYKITNKIDENKCKSIYEKIENKIIEIL